MKNGSRRLILNTAITEPHYSITEEDPETSENDEEPNDLSNQLINVTLSVYILFFIKKIFTIPIILFLNNMFILCV